jgi:hypothetical protein
VNTFDCDDDGTAILETQALAQALARHFTELFGDFCQFA